MHECFSTVVVYFGSDTAFISAYDKGPGLCAHPITFLLVHNLLQFDKDLHIVIFFFKSQRIQLCQCARVLLHSSGTLAQTRPLFHLATKTRVFLLISVPCTLLLNLLQFDMFYLLLYFSLKAKEFSHGSVSTVVRVGRIGI